MAKEKTIRHFCMACGAYNWKNEKQKECFICGCKKVYMAKTDKRLDSLQKKRSSTIPSEDSKPEIQEISVEEFLNKFVEIVAKKMKENYWTKKDLGNKLGVTPRFVSKIFKGDSTMTIMFIFEIAEKLDIKIKLEVE